MSNSWSSRGQVDGMMRFFMKNCADVLIGAWCAVAIWLVKELFRKVASATVFSVLHHNYSWQLDTLLVFFFFRFGRFALGTVLTIA